MDAADRRKARAAWSGQVFRSWEEAEAFDAAYWLRIPVEDRARVAWELSLEMHRLAHPDEPDHEPRLSRSVARITRR